jgi:hypothetical protein
MAIQAEQMRTSRLIIFRLLIRLYLLSMIAGALMRGV